MIPPLSGKVLVVEDNLVNQKLTCSILKKIGLKYDVANDGAEALALWQNNSFDLILMDCQMPVMDGYIATEEIRRQETSGHTPIVALTANAMENDDIRCLNSGMDDFLSKPFVINDLAIILQKWLGKSSENTAGQSESLGLDYAALEELKQSLEDDFDEVIDIYIESTTNILDQMREALDQAEDEEIKRLAHSLKSSSANIGATKLSEIAQALEQQLTDGVAENIKEKIDEMQKLFLEFSPALRKV